MTSENRPWVPQLPSGTLSHPATLKDSTEALIRRALVSGEMRPGELYSANKLASQLEVSNSPVREAMMSLVNSGLLELVRNRGFRVVELTEEDKREVYELRLHIEVDALRRIANRGITPEQAEYISTMSQNTVDLIDAPLVDYLEADQQYHLALVGLLGNKRWKKIVENLRDLSRVNGYYTFLEDSDHIAHSADEHQQITQAIINGEPELAAALMVKHLEYARPKQR
ncbi:GntR family transcriptional regulator [Yaniella sp.]|uniref:GntR family transcriptional regulator n=1 Tax=Yaniella sp. TaxID=2773929 RepID=UPI002649F157|nr:GntR family transcriptional regulator [Yaniella sp.]MDN6358770.1 GntR family transcriptional regulator [Yaniella sp.]